jgi:hypothetical protein
MLSSTAIDHLKSRESRRMVAYRFCKFGCAVVPLLLVVSDTANLKTWRDLSGQIVQVRETLG